MIIKYIDGTESDTNKMNDCDAILTEKCQELLQLFSKYDRQLFIAAETKLNTSSAIYNIASPETKECVLISSKINKFWHIIDMAIRKTSNNSLFLINK